MSAHIRVNKARLDKKQSAIQVSGLLDARGRPTLTSFAYQVDFTKDGVVVAHVIQIDHSVFMEPADGVELVLRETP